MSDKHRTVRVARALAEEATREGAIFNRSAAAQLEHWARLGKAFEAAKSTTTGRVRQALTGQLPIEALEEAEQDAAFEEMVLSYQNPSTEVRARYAEIGAATDEALERVSGRQHAA